MTHQLNHMTHQFTDFASAIHFKTYWWKWIQPISLHLPPSTYDSPQKIINCRYNVITEKFIVYYSDTPLTTHKITCTFFLVKSYYNNLITQFFSSLIHFIFFLDSVMKVILVLYCLSITFCSFSFIHEHKSCKLHIELLNFSVICKFDPSYPDLKYPVLFLLINFMINLFHTSMSPPAAQLEFTFP